MSEAPVKHHIIAAMIGADVLVWTRKWVSVDATCKRITRKWGHVCGYMGAARIVRTMIDDGLLIERSAPGKPDEVRAK